MSLTSPRPPGGAARHAKVHRDSRGIQKPSSPPSSSSTNSSVSSSSTNSRPAPPPRQKPVIIYTHSPKVIRTSPRDFMSIVQKLTGLDNGPSRTAARNNAGPPAAAAAQDESSSSSSESCPPNAHAHAHAVAPHPYADPRLMPPPPPALDAHSFVAAAPDIPLFAAGPSELQLCVPQGLYDHFPPIDAAQLGPAMMSSSANNMNSGAAGNGGPVFSPSMVEAMRMFPDY
ncbi:hypothetical protein QOZ80_2AG0117940 [Eleusine coracana subsp. coracana]|nr:hypothetical protein QOZ80_2AG0117940 [Eleusine coracana subsp. coracana]